MKNKIYNFIFSKLRGRLKARHQGISLNTDQNNKYLKI